MVITISQLLDLRKNVTSYGIVLYNSTMCNSPDFLPSNLTFKKMFECKTIFGPGKRQLFLLKKLFLNTQATYNTVLKYPGNIQYGT